ncbi:MAG: beta-propeller domain-containing protein [Planctomycetota bacterium]|nr:beta-propeller domain-containing protein [Planctomycetota bacterium]
MRNARTNLVLGAFLVVVWGSTTAWAQNAAFQRGDANTDGRLDLSDPVFSLARLFLGGPDSTCEDAEDGNDDGHVDVSDAIFALRYLFAGGTPPPAPGLSCGVDPTPDELTCSSHLPCGDEEPRPGQSDFETPLDQGGFARGGGFLGVDGAEGAKPAAPDADAGQQEAAPERELEEADLYRIFGQHLYALNRYRGLYIIDISDLDRPEVLGRAPIFGYPREMYVRGTTAYILVTDFYTFGVDPESGLTRGSYGSQVRIVDVSDVRKPRVLRNINLDGYLTDSRIVGDVLYLVSQQRPWYYSWRNRPLEDKTVIHSLRLGLAEDVEVIDVQDFPRDGWEHHLHVTPNAIYLSSSGYSRSTRSYETRLKYIDISDPGGLIRVRGEAVAPGRVQDRWSIDEEDGVLRVASGQSWGNGDIHLSTYAVDDPDRISQLGRTTLHIRERLTAARFDGSRGYLVSFRNIDPLFVFDLSNPRRPRLLGELEMTGWLDFLVPMGDRVIALGREEVTTPEGWRSFDLAVSLIDVSQLGVPRLLSRVTLDGLWASVPATRDDFAKVFRTLPRERLVLFPFRAWDRRTYRYQGGVQLIDLDPDQLTRRGVIDGGGLVERGIPFEGQADTVLTLGTEEFQIVDIGDRDNPRVRGELELARNIQEFSFLGKDHTVQFSGDWYRGDTKLTVTPIDDPNATRPTSEVEFPARQGRMFTNGSLAYIASQQLVDEETWRYQTDVKVVDLSDPASPVERGSVRLPEEVPLGYHYWYWGYGNQTAQVNGSTLAILRHSYSYYYRECLSCVQGGADGRDDGNKIFVVDLSDPDAPRLGATIVLDDANWVWGLKSRGSMLFFSTYRVRRTATGWIARYYLRRIDLSDPSNPVELPEVNIPGMFLEATEDLDVIYTLETRWDYRFRRSRTYLYALQLGGDRAFLLSRVEFDGYLNSVQIDDGVAVGSLYRYGYEIVDGRRTWWNRSFLVAIDLSDPRAVRVASETEVPVTHAYLQKFTGRRAFTGCGPGLFVYSFEDPEQPVFESFFRRQGWSQDVLLRENKAYVPSGYYGVQVFQLPSR